MKNRITISIFALSFVLLNQIYSQSYYYLVNQGVAAEYDMSAPNGLTIMTSPMNDKFSSVQTLLFTWNFYGQPVTQYKVSDNGYITFDLSASVSDPNNTSIPSAPSPNNSIYAFWDNLELSNNPSFVTNKVKTYTIGSAPNRVHVIQWDVTPLGKTANGNYLYFALRIYEQGDFDILLQQIRLDSGTMSGTVGCENASGTDGTMVSGSPSLMYKGGVVLKETVPVYTFIRGTQPQYDVLMKKLDLPLLASSNTSCDVKGTIINHGTQTINTLEIAYQVENNPIQSTSLSGLNFQTNQSYDFKHSKQWKPTNIGTYEKVKVWISKINDQADMHQTDDTLTHTAFVNNGLTAPKKVLIEEFSTAPCGYCPDGHIVLENILSKYPNVIGVTHHSGYQTDAMTINESVEIADAFAFGAPTACIDRILWPKQSRVAISRSDWEARALEAASKAAPVGIKITHQWNEQTKNISIQIDLDFIDYPYPGDMRINVFVVEDSVTGTGKGYDQTNYYNNDPTRPSLYQKGDPIVGYVHRQVIRAVPTNTWGEANIIPTNVALGHKINRNYSYTVPSGCKVKDIIIIAFVSYDDGEKKEILNTETHKDIKTNVDDVSILPSQLVVVYPNPVTGTATIKYRNEKYEFVSLKIFNSLGREVMRLVDDVQETGVHQQAFDGRGFTSGMYYYRLQTGNKLIGGKILIVK